MSKEKAQIMDLETIVNSLEQWMVDVPDEPDEERLLRHLVQSAPGEFAMHREWVNEHYKSLGRAPVARLFPVSPSTRYRQWQTRAKTLAPSLKYLYELAQEPTLSPLLETRRLRKALLGGIAGIRTRMRIAGLNDGYALAWQERRQNVLLFRNALLFWELQARLIRRRYRKELGL